MESRQLDCNLCSLREQSNQVVWGRGNREAKLAIFAELPGKEEDRFNLPLVGANGLMTEKMLLSIGIEIDEVYYSNIVKCRTKDDKALTKPEIKFCTKQHLLTELRSLPNLEWIWILGKVTYYGIHGKDPKITQELGRVDTLNIGDGRILQTVLLFHPSYLIGSPSMDPGSRKEKQWKQLITWKENHWS